MPVLGLKHVRSSGRTRVRTHSGGRYPPTLFGTGNTSRPYALRAWFYCARKTALGSRAALPRIHSTVTRNRSRGSLERTNCRLPRPIRRPQNIACRGGLNTRRSPIALRSLNLPSGKVLLVSRRPGSARALPVRSCRKRFPLEGAKAWLRINGDGVRTLFSWEC